MDDARPTGETPFAVSFRADPDAAHGVREAFEGWCAARGLGQGEVHDLALALQEALDNVVEHAYRDATPGAVVVEANLVGDEVVVEVRDRGPEFDPLEGPLPELGDALGERRVGGLGLRLLRRLVDDARYRRADGWNRLVLVKRVPGS